MPSRVVDRSIAATFSTDALPPSMRSSKARRTLSGSWRCSVSSISSLSMAAISTPWVWTHSFMRAVSVTAGTAPLVKAWSSALIFSLALSASASAA